MSPVIHQRFEPLITYFDEIDDNRLFVPQDMVIHLAEGASRMATHFPDWANWSAELTEGTMLATHPYMKKFMVGRNRRPQEGEKIKSSYFHEMVHGARVNGLLKAGVPASLDLVTTSFSNAGEEGTAVLYEKVFKKETDVSPYSDGGTLYLATALAMGTFSAHPPMQRVELEEVLARIRLAGKSPKRNAVWVPNTAARIYRGTPASTETNTGVSTMGIAYRAEFVTAVDAAVRMLDKGISPETVFDYTLLASFNPEDKIQAQYLRELYERAGGTREVKLIDNVLSLLNN